MMVSSSFDFDRTLAYALSCVKQEGLGLKDQQVEAVKQYIPTERDWKQFNYHIISQYTPRYTGSACVGHTQTQCVYSK